MQHLFYYFNINMSQITAYNLDHVVPLSSTERFSIFLALVFLVYNFTVLDQSAFIFSKKHF